MVVAFENRLRTILLQLFDWSDLGEFFRSERVIRRAKIGEEKPRSDREAASESKR